MESYDIIVSKSEEDDSFVVEIIKEKYEKRKNISKEELASLLESAEIIVLGKGVHTKLIQYSNAIKKIIGDGEEEQEGRPARVFRRKEEAEIKEGGDLHIEKIDIMPKNTRIDAYIMKENGEKGTKSGITAETLYREIMNAEKIYIAEEIYAKLISFIEGDAMLKQKPHKKKKIITRLKKGTKE